MTRTIKTESFLEKWKKSVLRVNVQGQPGLKKTVGIKNFSCRKFFVVKIGKYFNRKFGNS